MQIQHYQVVFLGEIQSGRDLDQTKKDFAARFKLSDTQVDNIFSVPRFILKKEVEEPEARRYQEQLQFLGLVTHIEPMAIQSSVDNSAPESLPVTNFSTDLADTVNHSADSATPDVGAAVMVDNDNTVNGKPIPFQFLGDGTEYFKIWIANIFLSIITLGIYSAWAKVRNQQYFYGNTRLDNSSFEYLATPIQILKSRILAVVIFVAYSLLSEMSPYLGLGLALLFLVFLPWILVRGLRFNARVSSYRNIRFNFHGSAGQAAITFIGWPLLGILTLGILFPLAFFKQQQFIINHHSYGTSRFAFTGKLADFYSLFLILMGVGFLVSMVVSFTGFLHPFLPVMLMVGVYFFIMVYFTVRKTNLVLNAISLRENKFSANWQLGSYSQLLFVNTLCIVLTLGLFIPWAMVRAARYKAEHLSFIARQNIDDFVADEKESVSALGEELADVFDVDIAAF